MLTALKVNILEALSPDSLGVHPGEYLVLEDGRIAGIYPALPANMAEASVTDFGDALILQSFADMHLHGPQYEFAGTGMDRPLLEWLEASAFPAEARYADPGAPVPLRASPHSIRKTACFPRTAPECCPRPRRPAYGYRNGCSAWIYLS